MSTQKTASDVAWLQNGVDVYQIDLSQPAETEPKSIDRFISYAFDTQWTGTPNGLLYLAVTQASAQKGLIVAGQVPIFWVSVDSQTLALGSGNFPASSPSSQGELANGHNFAKLIWVPNNNSSGALYALFGGVLQ